MKKLIIFMFAIFFVALKVFGLSDLKTENPNMLIWSSESWLYLIVAGVLFLVFIWALYDWGWLKRNGFFNKNPNKKPKKFNPTKDMEDIASTKEAFLIITRLQEVIHRKTGYNFRFEFTINEDQNVVLSTRFGFSFEIRDKEKKRIEKKFIGSSVSEVILDFMNFFSSGMEGLISKDENGFQFSAQFHYAGEWVVSNGSVQHYYYTEGDD